MEDGGDAAERVHEVDGHVGRRFEADRNGRRAGRVGRDGELDGKPVRYSGQALNQWDGAVRPDAYEGTFGPITIVLNRVQPR